MKKILRKQLTKIRREKYSKLIPRKFPLQIAKLMQKKNLFKIPL